MLIYGKRDRSTALYHDGSIVQGSISADYVDFLAPFPSTSVVTIAFTLPNGTQTSPGVMTRLSSEIDGKCLWRYRFADNLTEYSGRLKMQVFVTAENITNAMEPCEAEIVSGVPYVIPATSVTWDSILQIYNSMLDIYQASLGIKVFIDEMTADADIFEGALYYAEANESTVTFKAIDEGEKAFRLLNAGGYFDAIFELPEGYGEDDLTLTGNVNLSYSSDDNAVFAQIPEKTYIVFVVRNDDGKYYIDAVKTENGINTVLKETTHAENIIISGDFDAQDADFHGTVTVPPPTLASGAVPKSYADARDIRVTVMPTPATEGTVVQFIGSTTSQFKKGYFYLRHNSAWEQLPVQPSSVADIEEIDGSATPTVDEGETYDTYTVDAVVSYDENGTEKTKTVTLIYKVKKSSSSDSNAVHYTADAGKTSSEKAQARANIDAQKVFQFDTIPANATVGAIIQFVGTTGASAYVSDGTATNGYFYKFNGTFWQRINVQPAGIAGATWGQITGDIEDQTDLINLIPTPGDGLSEDFSVDPARVPYIEVTASEGEVVVKTEDGWDTVNLDLEIQNYSASEEYVDEAVGAVASRVGDLEAVVPSEATSSNKLADKAFVTEAMQTNAANFRGNWITWASVPTNASLYPADYAGSKTPTVNDYLVVQDASGYDGEDALEGTWLFKYSGVWATNGKSGWLPEYQVNETPLTAAQLAALNSGITASKVNTYNGYASQISSKLDTAGNGLSKSGTTVAVNPSKVPYNPDGFGTYSGLVPMTTGANTWGQALVSNDPIAYSVAQRDGNSNLKVGTPVSDEDATPKSYVDSKTVKLFISPNL